MLALLERRAQLPEGELDAAAQGSAASCTERGFQAVGDGQQALGEALDGELLGAGGLVLRALAGVLGLGERAHHRVALLLDLGLGLGELFLEGFLAGCSACWV